MYYSLDTNPPSFPAGVRLEDLINMIDDVKEKFSVVFRVLPHAVANFIFAQETPPDKALLALKSYIDEHLPIDSVRFGLYPLIFGSVYIAPLISAEFADFHKFFLASFADDSLFQASFDYSDNTESEADAGPNIVFPTYPGCFLPQSAVLARFRYSLTANQQRFILQLFLRADSKFLLFYEVAEFAVWFLSALSVSGCQMREFFAASYRVFEFLGEIQNQNLIAEQYNAFAEFQGPYSEFDAFVQYVVEPRISAEPLKCCKTLERIILNSNLSVNNVFYLVVYLFEANFQHAFAFIAKLQVEIPGVALDFDSPFAEEDLLDNDTMEIVDDMVSKLSDEYCSKFIALACDMYHITLVYVVLLLRVLTLHKLTIYAADFSLFTRYVGYQELFLELFAYDLKFLDYDVTEDVAKPYYAVLSRFLLEHFDESMRPRLESLVSKMESRDDLSACNNQIVYTFLKDNSDYVRLNLNTYLKLFRRNDNLVLYLSNRFFYGGDDCQLAQLALQTLPSSDAIPREIVQSLTVKLFDFAFGYFYTRESVPTEAVACFTAFYSSYDISPQFCGAVNGLRCDFLKIYENLKLDYANLLLLPGFLLLMTSLFEVPIAETTTVLSNFLLDKRPEQLVAASKDIQEDFASYSFIFNAAIRLILLNGPDNADVSPQCGKYLVDIFIFYAKAALDSYQVVVTIVEALVEAFQNQYGAIMVIFRRMGRILSCLTGLDSKQYGEYVYQPVGTEILILALGGLACFELGPQWGSNYYINSKYISTLLQQVLSYQVAGTADALVLRYIYAIKYVRNSLMGDQQCSSPFYKQAVLASRDILRIAAYNKQFEQLQQAAISYLINAYCCNSSAAMDCRVQNPAFYEVLTACQRLTWEDENSLSITFSMLEQLLQRRQVYGKYAGEAHRTLAYLEHYLHEDEEGSDDSV